MIRATTEGRARMGMALAILLATSPVASRAEGPSPAVAADSAVAEKLDAPAGPTATVTHGPNGYAVEGRFRVNAPVQVAWEVLTDYDGIPRFVSSMRSSRVSERGDGYLMVEQEATGRLLLFKRQLRTTLKVQEEPPGIIRFEDVLKKDFEHYRGEWRIEDRSRELEIVYRVQAQPTSSIPSVVARGMFKHTVRQLLSELEKEIVNRAALAESLPPERSQP